MMAFIGAAVTAGVDYLTEYHQVGAGNGDVYLDGVLVANDNGAGSVPGMLFELTNSSDDGTKGDAFYYISDVKVGTTRGGTEKFSDPLTSLPATPHWDGVENPTDGGFTGLVVATVGAGNRVKVTDVNDMGVVGPTQFSCGTTSLGFTGAGTWYTFTIRFGSTLEAVVLGVDGFHLNVFSGGASFRSYAIEAFNAVHLKFP